MYLHAFTHHNQFPLVYTTIYKQILSTHESHGKTGVSNRLNKRRRQQQRRLWRWQQLVEPSSSSSVHRPSSCGCKSGCGRWRLGRRRRRREQVQKRNRKIRQTCWSQQRAGGDVLWRWQCARRLHNRLKPVDSPRCAIEVEEYYSAMDLGCGGLGGGNMATG